ncbi:MAG: aldehyde dehydrogenase family protein [Candidatus Melainabacteria bacterium]|nr:aldehyde dehydrogenase family protein [Candidatus Melainabacteria bacterium]
MPATIKENLIKVTNPATGEEIFTAKATSETEIKEIIQRAKESFLLWSSMTVDKRIDYLKKIYELIIKDKDKIAEIITKNTGKPLSESYLTEIASCLQIMEYFIKKGHELLNEKSISLGKLYPTKKSFLSYEPYGVMAIIEPWNYPFYLPMSAITKTLLAGNTFIFKPSSKVSLVGKLIYEILLEAALPQGVANIVYGGSEAAEVLISSGIDKVIFTGSVEIGKKIAESCAKKLLPVSLELGGKDPAIVFKNTNLDYACEGVLWGAISNCGQACASIERVYVESEIYNDFIDKITSLVKELKIGNGIDDEIDVGPLIDKEQVEKIEEHIKDALNKGARLHTGGKRIPGSGFFFEPTVLSNVNHSMKIMTEETFGPVIPIMKFESIEEAIRLANDTRYGLASSIWTGETGNVKNIANKLNCGTVWVNDSLFLQAHPACPWQGYKDSGYGGSAIYDFVRTKHISIDLGFIPKLHPKSFWWYPYKGKARSYSDLIGIVFKSSIKEKTKAAFHTMINFLK